MNTNDLNEFVMERYYRSIPSLLIFLLFIMYSGSTTADTGVWQTQINMQAYWQGYQESSSRENAYNLGMLLNNEYLDKASVGFSYNYTYLDLNGAELGENLFSIGGRYHLYMDEPAGKLTLRLDAYFGENTLRYTTLTPGTAGSGMGGRGRQGGGASTLEDSVDITIFNPIVAFLSQNKTLYVDLGYAYSEYSGLSVTKISQIAPAIGFPWNDQYDWLLFRAYLIDVDDSDADFGQEYESLELKYTHWFTEQSKLELIRFAVLLGERSFAVDADAVSVYTLGDEQKSGVSASIKWRLNGDSRFLALANYSRFKNNSENDDYDTLTIYFNVQSQW